MMGAFCSSLKSKVSVRKHFQLVAQEGGLVSQHLASASDLLQLPDLPLQGLRLLLHLCGRLVHQVAQPCKGRGEFLLHLVKYFQENILDQKKVKKTWWLQLALVMSTISLSFLAAWSTYCRLNSLNFA